MYPILFSIGSISVYTYGVFVALGIFVGLMLLEKQAKKRGLNADIVGSFAFWAIVFAIVGSRIGWVVQYWPMYKGNWLAILNVREGGLAFHGGLIGAILVGFYYVFRYKISLAKLADAAALPLCLGYAIGRMGCFFNGCCWGIPTTMPWGVATRFAEGLRHPVQLYDSLLTLVLFGFIVWRSKSTKFGGQLFLETLMGFAIVRLFVEFFRDSVKFNAVLNQTQVLMVGLFVVPFVIQIINLRKVKSVKQNEPRNLKNR
ncbi:MAG: prolipoprotein diacylglyceryl transferase [Firmicutes bacterium]|nr:prolipoprotein diacylglyceryl transferase [Bacillota bacterium]